MRLPKIEVISLGSELLLGLRANRHLVYLGEQLSRRGVIVRRNVVIADEETSISEEFLDSWRKSDVVITTGGLGPTSDDITPECVAKALGIKRIHDPEIEKGLERFYEEQGRDLPERAQKIALRMEGAEVLPNEVGLSPGVWLEHDGKVLIMLPGPVVELRTMFEQEVLPRLEKKGILSAGESYIQLRTAGLGETAIGERLDAVFESVPQLEVAYCAHTGLVDMRLGYSDGHLTRKQLEGIAHQCAKQLGEHFICFGHDSLEEIVLKILRQRDRTLAVAESCTGGMLANRFTDIAGASKVFVGGAVCYSNDAKIELLGIPECLLTQHGAVSSEAAAAMANNVCERLVADYGLSITGFAGPSGGTEVDPVGTVYIGLNTPEGVWSKKCHFPGNRQSVRVRAANAALDWLRRELVKKELRQPVHADAIG